MKSFEMFAETNIHFHYLYHIFTMIHHYTNQPTDTDTDTDMGHYDIISDNIIYIPTRFHHPYQ
jgi:hypothetical protein